MGRPQPPLPSSRNRNRITNKSRLKIVRGDVALEPVILDEDEEKNRLLQSVAGVDQDDANEHHLQQVLSAASFRSQAVRSAEVDKSQSSSSVFIPTPDSTGIVDNYESLYPANRWSDPVPYIFSSLTVEECISGALAHGATYYMDEKDEEWVSKNNEEARGVGTSSQAALSSGTRTSARSTKAKGKDSDNNSPIEISEDQFELVMGLFELITHEETEYLHHSLSGGMPFPDFSNYQDTFANELSPAHFSAFKVPSWVPPPSQLLRIARLVYPHWKERRLDRGGLRITPTLNFDEQDTLNESYVCFRQREVKAVRKTRASQVNSSDKLASLSKQLADPLDIANRVLEREKHKMASIQLHKTVWERRLALVELKRKNPTLGDRTDTELLVDKEKPVKKPDPRPPRVSTTKRESIAPSPIIRAEPAIRPSKRLCILSEEIESAMQRVRTNNVAQNMEDVIENPHYAPLPSYASRLFKFMPPSNGSSSTLVAATASDSDSEAGPSTSRQSMPIRLRTGRGGRMHKKIEGWRNGGVSMQDDEPMVPAGGSDEQDRTLVDDYDIKYLRHSMRIMAEVDPAVMNDPSIIVHREGTREMVFPFRLGIPVNVAVRPPIQPPRPPPISAPIAIQQAPQAAVANNSRLSSTIQSHATTPTPTPTTANGGGRAAITMPHIDTSKGDVQDGRTVNGLSLQQLQQLKSAFATTSPEMAKYIPPVMRPQWTNLATAVPQNGDTAATDVRNGSRTPVLPVTTQSY
ncbi:enhancer of polycomb-like-domain-containing protein [Desarmillaria tabescens]|uniref:Enhancer of polycomb-like protein n=1 Tax=Armillaria tabescens TaxID=1929756 RepID=A0AA39JEA9_ARMTA|nr:enhancer of polycomb-like-domain-containing protein [Desarmillaria tabescens]KAK0441186.1 enhancer of polycomb-like-domain-containing protein [Desarmillaria tabescens]